MWESWEEKNYIHTLRKNKILLRIYFTTTNFLLHWKIILIIFFLLFSMNFFFFLIYFEIDVVNVLQNVDVEQIWELFSSILFQNIETPATKSALNWKKTTTMMKKKKKYSKLGLGSKHKLYHQTSNSTHNIKSNCRRVENFVRKKCQQIFKTFLTN